ncbi:DUF4401 domain-containing protein [Massilia sp. CCM 8733]|uniref:DUF4401 domain-containing protein n=1 Tax=Massilia mucilaginosa TaxID=2609282 RepID=A0ABX0P660_9BURK|nr:GDYXXLXY domain-containing protein [Massilia mucilaginosa]NHZ93912.1 DUF4401 domain-containing protein [Massilia mucilaginosa]
MKRPLDQIVAEAVAANVLPSSAGAVVEREMQRPWSVVLLTGLGAWLAALPLLASIFFLLERIWKQSSGVLYLIALVLCGSAVLILRRRSLPLFAEQLAIPALLAGATAMTIAFYSDMSTADASVCVALLSAFLAAMIPRHWLRVLLGAMACAFIMIAVAQLATYRARDGFWMALHAAMATWLLVECVQRRHVRSLLLDRLATGWALTLLAGLAVWTGMTFMLGGAIGSGAVEALLPLTQPLATVAQFISAAMAIGAAVWLAKSWPALRRPWYALACAVFTGLAALMPSLGGTLLIFSLCASSGRWGTAAMASAAAAWITGALYYQLDYPLVTKAMILTGAGALFALIAWLAMRDSENGRANSKVQPSLPDSHGARIGIAVTAMTVLAIANIGIWQKENLIANGRPILVELAPVDPRSLMQGDYMRLNFKLPADVLVIDDHGSARARPKVVGMVNAQGIAELSRRYDGKPLAPGEIMIELTPNGRGYTLATDAWHFKEGEAARWQAAKYGEFRVDDKGKALLVGMRGVDLAPL